MLRWAAPQLAERPLSVLGEGWDNLVVTVGDDLLLRLPRRDLGAELLSGELDFLATWAASLPAPVPRIVQRIPPSEDYPLPCALVARVHGQTADRAPPQDRRGVGIALGGFLRVLHDLPPTSPSPSPGYPLPTGPHSRRPTATSTKRPGGVPGFRRSTTPSTSSGLATGSAMSQ